VHSTAERSSHDTGFRPHTQPIVVLVVVLLLPVVDCKHPQLRCLTILGQQSRQPRVEGAVMIPDILIVDGDTGAAQVTRAVVARIIPEATLAVAATFEQAWRIIQSQRPDALIIDPSPQSREGARLIEQLKAAYPAACVIVVASMPTPALRRTMAGLGVDSYLEKPALLPLLRQELYALLGNGAPEMSQA
jgi:CheY-like chemotaxis protein